ncbi:uncharacterized protein LOC144097057 [Amblyomma americanum]
MATGWRCAATASPDGHRRQQEQSAEPQTRSGYDQGEREQDERDGAESDLEADLVSGPAVVPPFFHSQAQPATLSEPSFPLSLHGSSEEDEGFELSSDVGYDDDSDLELQDEHALYDLAYDTRQQLEYLQFLESFAGLNADDSEEQIGTGEPQGATGGAYEADMSPLNRISAEGSGDALTEQEAVEPDLWQYLREHDPWEEDVPFYGPVVSSSATVSILLRHRVRVDISVEGAVRVVNFAAHCTAALGRWGDRSCLCHPCGRVVQEGDYVDMATGSRLAKISGRGITFTNLSRGLVYLVDASGTKSTTERFEDLNYDLPSTVFHLEPEPDIDSFNECFRIVSQARHRTATNGDEIWTVGDVLVEQTVHGDVQVSRDSGRLLVCTSPTAGSMSLTTPLIKTALSCDPRKFFFVRVGQKRLRANEAGFMVRNGCQRAGFDRRGRIVLP